MVAFCKTKELFKIQVCERLGISHLTEKKVKIDENKPMILEDLLCCNYSPSFAGFAVLTRENNDFKLKIMKSLLIVCEKSVLNKAHSSLSLEFFCLICFIEWWSPSMPLCVYRPFNEYFAWGWQIARAKVFSQIAWAIYCPP